MQLNVTKGRIVTLCSALASASKFEVKTDVGLVGLQAGSGFDVDEHGLVRCNWGKLIEVFIVNGVVVPPLSIESGRGGYFDQWRIETKPMGAEELRPLSSDLESLKKEREAANWKSGVPAAKVKSSSRIRVSKAHPNTR